ncbi:hypothetical protein V5799_010998 [Amblyomma americanum]|uniref:Uncharacterized protein n=1 Tax=Amblyomma americanum TaxID=6943 RepID=A0AAQ4EI36_AMBAM
MDKIDDIRVTELKNSAYIKPKRLFFKQCLSCYTQYNQGCTHLCEAVSSRAGVIEGAMDELFFVEVTDDMKKTAGGGLEEQGEMIDVVELTRAEAKNVLFDDRIMKPAVLLFGVTWFLEVKSKQQKGLNHV